jgi:hypothetical protein
MGKRQPQQPGPQIHSSKWKANQLSAPVASATYALEKAQKKPKAAE